MKSPKQTIIVICGADMTGKTQIAKALSKKLKIPYFKNTGEWKNFNDPKDYFVNTVRYAEPFFTSYLDQTKSSVIMDRGYPCEYVYAQAFGRVTDMKMLETVDEIYARLGAKIIICHRSSYEGVTDDMFPNALTSDKLREIDEIYTKFTSWTKCETIRINVDDEDLGREIRDITVML